MAETSGNATTAKPRQDEAWGARGCCHSPWVPLLAAGVPRGAGGPADLKCPVTSALPNGPSPTWSSPDSSLATLGQAWSLTHRSIRAEGRPVRL